ncbi:MAG: hypothetical protein HY909_20755 [Deltaproteobacteria bacterium]|nr:hypothetical protein [Deltaproteobacteria bacterium]
MASRRRWWMVLGALAACGPEADPQSPALEPQEAVAGFVSEASFLVPVAEGLTGFVPGVTPPSVERAAERAAERAPMLFRPLGCATARSAGAGVALAMVNCRVASGLARVEGTLTGLLAFTYTVRMGGVSARVESRGLRVGAVRLDSLALDLDFSYRLGRLRMDVVSEARGTNSRAQMLHRTGRYAAVWEAATACFALDGSWLHAGGGMSTITGYRRCGARCPEPGGRLVYSGSRGTVVLDFQGGTTGRFEANGVTGTFPVDCGE